MEVEVVWQDDDGSLGGWVSVVAGAAMLALPIVHPSPWLAAPVWLGFIFLSREGLSLAEARRLPSRE